MKNSMENMHTDVRMERFKRKKRRSLSRNYMHPTYNRNVSCQLIAHDKKCYLYKPVLVMQYV